MKAKRAPLLKYLSGVSLLLTSGLFAANLGDWSAPVNLGNTINAASNEQCRSSQRLVSVFTLHPIGPGASAAWIFGSRSAPASIAPGALRRTWDRTLIRPRMNNAPTFLPMVTRCFLPALARGA